MIGIFGSAFNPPTKGHAFVLNQALERFDRVIAVPSYHHGFGKKMAPFELRLSLTEQFVRDLGHDRITVSGIERELWTGEAVYSIVVLRAMKSLYPNEHIKLIIGPDNAEKFHLFRYNEMITREFGIYVAEDAEHFPRSTEIRQRMSQNDPYHEAVTQGVAKLLKDNHHHFKGI